MGYTPTVTVCWAGLVVVVCAFFFSGWSITLSIDSPGRGRKKGLLALRGGVVIITPEKTNNYCNFTCFYASIHERLFTLESFYRMRAHFCPGQKRELSAGEHQVVFGLGAPPHEHGWQMNCSHK